jgi:exodeoxyribonuclease VII small subunit
MPTDHSSDPNDTTPSSEDTGKAARITPKTRASASKSKRTFEQAIAEVEEIVSKLEGGKLELANSLDEYQRGIGTLKECYELLSSAERRVTLLSGFDIDGNPITEPFGDQPMTTEEKQAARPARRSSPQSRARLTELQSGNDFEADDSQEGLF